MAKDLTPLQRALGMSPPRSREEAANELQLAIDALKPPVEKLCRDLCLQYVTHAIDPVLAELAMTYVQRRENSGSDAADIAGVYRPLADLARTRQDLLTSNSDEFKEFVTIVDHWFDEQIEQFRELVHPRGSETVEEYLHRIRPVKDSVDQGGLTRPERRRLTEELTSAIVSQRTRAYLESHRRGKNAKYLPLIRSLTEQGKSDRDIAAAIRKRFPLEPDAQSMNEERVGDIRYRAKKDGTW